MASTAYVRLECDTMGLKDMFTPTNLANDYECNNCGSEFSKELSVDETLTCPQCGSEDVDRV